LVLKAITVSDFLHRWPPRQDERDVVFRHLKSSVTSPWHRGDRSPSCMITSEGKGLRTEFQSIRCQRCSNQRRDCRRYRSRTRHRDRAERQRTPRFWAAARLALITNSGVSLSSALFDCNCGGISAANAAVPPATATTHANRLINNSPRLCPWSSPPPAPPPP
jgi:hypothetical protein